MSQALLKQGLGDASAEFSSDHSSGPAGIPTKLNDILNQLCKPKPYLSVHNAGAIATGVLGRLVMNKADTLRELAVRVDVCGTAGQTSVQVRVNAAVVANGTLVVDNADPDPSQKKIVLGAGGPNGGAGVDVKDGDIVDINISVAPTAGTGISATLYGGPVGIE
jgi:hypothetical protein